MNLDSVVCQPKGQHQASVIWLHGLGDSGHGFAPIVPHLALPEQLGIKFIFPHAPQRAVTINGGVHMPAWYDIKSMDLDKRADEAGVIESAAQVEALIQAELDAGISADKIILAGFSQGGVIALHLAPRLAVKLAGVMALSTYMSAPAKMATQMQQAQLNVLMAHGRQDEVVPLFAGQQARDVLNQHHYQVSWHEFNMGHEVCAEELVVIRDWIINRLQ